MLNMVELKFNKGPINFKISFPFPWCFSKFHTQPEIRTILNHSKTKPNITSFKDRTKIQAMKESKTIGIHQDNRGVCRKPFHRPFSLNKHHHTPSNMENSC